MTLKGCNIVARKLDKPFMNNTTENIYKKRDSVMRVVCDIHRRTLYEEISVRNVIKTVPPPQNSL
jgi:hypothetical protein